MSKQEGVITRHAFREIQQRAAGEHGSDNVLDSALRRRLFGRSTTLYAWDLLAKLDIEIEILQRTRSLVVEAEGKTLEIARDLTEERNGGTE